MQAQCSEVAGQGGRRAKGEALEDEEASVRAKRQPESYILRAVRQFLELGGWYVIRHQAGLGTHPGLPDLQAIRDGRVVMIEVKSETGRLSAHQEAFRRAWEARGGEHIVARGVADVECLCDCLRL